MDEIMEIANTRGILVIEDSCQSHGALYKSRMTGSIGSCACYSFYPTKNMTTGEGGMITTNSDAIAEKCKLLRDHGQKTRYEHTTVGYNYRMTDIAAAIGLEQLKKLPEFNKKRQENAKILSEGLNDVKGVRVPYVPEGMRHVFHQYTIRAQKRDELKAHLEKDLIRAGVYYPRLITENPPLRPFVRAPLSQAEAATKEVLSLPVHPALSEDELGRIIQSVKAFYA
jgi:dTDP-4-amino-4,6-dideoxygalactose transaminase